MQWSICVMKILYISVHQILEDDEIRLLQKLGHVICCLGANGINGSVESFRPPINFSLRESELFELFRNLGGKYTYGGDPASFVIPRDFVEHFDLTIVMHDYRIFKHHWSSLSVRTVVWRTIGQNIDASESHIEPFRVMGLKIVRYSPFERLASNYVGHDAVIRFYKSESIYKDWTGENSNVLSFSHLYRQRYPKDAIDFDKIVKGLPTVLGGAGNDDLIGSVGVLTWDAQIELLRTSRLYLYAHGIEIPYTLNFIEAWMTGIPMVCYAPQERAGRFFEVDSLISDKIDGFICRSTDEATKILNSLRSDLGLAAEIGKAGRSKALELFSEKNARRSWSEFLQSV